MVHVLHLPQMIWVATLIIAAISSQTGVPVVLSMLHRLRVVGVLGPRQLIGVGGQVQIAAVHVASSTGGTVQLQVRQVLLQVSYHLVEETLGLLYCFSSAHLLVVHILLYVFPL